MPGILGFEGQHAGRMLTDMAAGLFKADLPFTQWLDRDRCAWLSFGLDKDVGIFERGEMALAFEGYVLNTDLRGSHLRRWLLERFILDGEQFAARLNGSFRMLIRRRGVTHVYVDQLASRPIFYAKMFRGWMFGPEAPPLLRLLGGITPSGPNMIQFMINGRFFAGQTAVEQLNQLEPGNYARIEQGKLTTHTYWRYRIEPTISDKEEALKELSIRLKTAIMSRWSRRAKPSILLSGGYDSRYIFNTIVAESDKPSDIHAVIWGENPDQPGSDIHIARTEAQRVGASFTLLPCETDIPRWFSTLFRAQSGMTGMTFSHVDEMPNCKLLHETYGIDAMFRGDEIFGPNGGVVNNRAEALAFNGLLSAASEPYLDACFLEDISNWLEAHQIRLEQIAADGGAKPDLVRDHLYLSQRLPACHGHLSYHRSHYLETINPLLDLDVIELWRHLPEFMRTDKSLFREAYHHAFGEHEFATQSNAFQWNKPLETEHPANRFLIERLSRLPILFNRNYLHDLVTQTQTHDHLIHPIKLASRALVLGCWLSVNRDDGPIHTFPKGVADAC